MGLTQQDLLEAVGEVLGHGLILTTTDGSVIASNQRARELVAEVTCPSMARVRLIPVDEIVERLRGGPPGTRVPFCAHRSNKPGCVGLAALIEGSPPLLLITIPPPAEESGYLGDQVLSILNHEFRTPLSTLSGFAELMLNREFDETARRSFLKMIRGESARLARLFKNLIELQRLRGRPFSLHLENLDLAGLVKEVCESQARIDPRRNVLIRLPRSRTTLPLDRPKMIRALEILLDTAFKLSQGTNQVVTRLRATRCELVASVTARGATIPSPAVGVLFNSDYRVQETSWPQFDCFSLPLAKAIVEAHCGRIWARVDPARGTVLSFSLPLPTQSV